MRSPNDNLSRYWSRRLRLDVPPYVDGFGPEPRIEFRNALLAPGEAAARRMIGSGDSHVGILSDAEALKELSRVFDATTTAGKS